MKRRSQAKTRKIGSYSRKVKAGTHPIIHHHHYEAKMSKYNFPAEADDEG